MQVQSQVRASKTTIMASSYTIIFALALFIELATRSTLALPKMKMDEEQTDQDRMVSVAGEDDVSVMGPGQLPFRRHPIIEGRLMDEDGTKRIFILADTGIKKILGREGNIANSKSYPDLLPHGTDNALDGFSMMDGRRNVDDVISVGRRDIDSKQVLYLPLFCAEVHDRESIQALLASLKTEQLTKHLHA